MGVGGNVFVPSIRRICFPPEHQDRSDMGTLPLCANIYLPRKMEVEALCAVKWNGQNCHPLKGCFVKLEDCARDTQWGQKTTRKHKRLQNQEPQKRLQKTCNFL